MISVFQDPNLTTTHKSQIPRNKSKQLLLHHLLPTIQFNPIQSNPILLIQSLFIRSSSAAIMTAAAAAAAEARGGGATTTTTSSSRRTKADEEEEEETGFQSFKDEKKSSEMKPFLTNSSTTTTINKSNGIKDHRRRRVVGSEASIPLRRPPPPILSNQKSFSQDMRHAAAETYLVTGLSFKLLRYLGVGYRWIMKFLALACYAMLLMPGFLQVAYYYFFSSQVRRSIVYGDQPRNRLDLYLPVSSAGSKPVVVFVTGGAWIIGYKAWGSLLGQQLAERNIIVACIDYRNFPQGTISDMVEDTSRGISFVCNNIAEYGGDPNRIYLMGQSAGAHIAACAIVDQAIKESGKGERSWSVSQIKAYLGISGGYNIINLVDHFHRRGLYRSVFLSIMEGEESLPRFSPEVVVQDPSIRNAVSALPPFVLLHGTADYSIPSDASKTFADVLRKVGAKAELILYEGKTHTDIFLQDPLRGGTDELLKDIVTYIRTNDKEAITKHDLEIPRRRLVPEFMLQLARKISPF